MEIYVPALSTESARCGPAPCPYHGLVAGSGVPSPAEGTVAETLTDDERRALREGCDHALQDHGLRKAADMLAELATLSADDLTIDEYGDGGAVAILESEVRELLGKPAAVFMPSGTMAQQIALRIHADRTNRRVVAFHPTCHLELHEDKAYQRLHGLVGLTLGNGRELLTLADIEAVREPLAALLIELPQREIGGRLPAWDDLVAQVAHVRERGAAVHLDGARLWESGPFYGRALSEVAALFDSVYVSFYKGLGGLAGSMLLGDDDLIAEARAWRSRHGGTLYQLWPYAAAGLAGSAEDGRLRRTCPGDRGGAVRYGGCASRARPTADADDASAPAHDRSRRDGRRSPDSHGAADVDLGRIVADRYPRYPPCGTESR